MMTMIERVAQAISIADLDPLADPEEHWTKLSEDERELCRKQAIAAITVMEEPTEMMVGATIPNYGLRWACAESPLVWRIMVEAALAERSTAK